MSRLQFSAEAALAAALGDSLELHLDGITAPGARRLALQDACQRLEQQLAAVPTFASGRVSPEHRVLIASALRRAAQDLEAAMPEAACAVVEHA